jgi:hypothetical protein
MEVKALVSTLALIKSLEHRAKAIQEAEDRILRSLTKDEALSNAISAADIYMEAIKLASTESERERLKSKCLKVLARAEDIKKVQHWSVPQGRGEQACMGRELKNPLSNRPLSSREEVILLESSRLHGSIFPPWTAEPRADFFKLKDGETLYQ